MSTRALIRSVASGMVVLSAVAYGADQRKIALVSLGDYDCLPVATFGLTGVRLWESASSVSKKLGKPVSITKSDGEDDGGRYQVTTYHYPALNIDFVRGVVDRIYTSSARLGTPEGIRIGDTRAEVIQKLGKPPRGWKTNALQVSIVTCPESGPVVREDYVTYQFDEAGHLLAIAYEANRP